MVGIITVTRKGGVIHSTASHTMGVGMKAIRIGMWRCGLATLLALAIRIGGLISLLV